LDPRWSPQVYGSVGEAVSAVWRLVPRADVGGHDGARRRPPGNPDIPATGLPAALDIHEQPIVRRAPAYLGISAFSDDMAIGIRFDLSRPSLDLIAELGFALGFEMYVGP